ncbi:MAG TPA: SprT family zinc-dependent metalloprotease [Gammaproteobacteria bacterium]|nr:SprT family zinc-dependent metalloprotease [Gammaproteobacteria bacterium]
MSHRRIDFRRPTGTVMGYTVRYSARAKRLQIRVRPWFGVEIVAPRRCALRQIERFVSAQRAWIESVCRELPLPPPADSLPDSIVLPAIGAAYRADYGKLAGRASVAERGRVLHVPAGPDDPAAARQQLRKWLAATTRAVLLPRLDELARRHGFKYHKVSVRGQRTRWGSCSSRKQISINYKLLFLAPDLVDYLFIHELAHTRQLNHSPRYWRVVEACLPDYRELEVRMSEAWKDVPGWVEIP